MRNQAPTRRSAGALLGAAVLLLTGACSDNGKTSAGSADVYRLMVIGPLTPSTTLPTPFPELAVGAKAGAEKVNSQGGVNGKKIEIVPCDSKADPNQATKCAQQAVQDGIPAVVGSFDLRGDYLSVLEAAGVPSIAPFTRTAEATSPVSYPVTGGSFALLAGEITLLADLGAKKIYNVLPEAGVAGQDLNSRFAPVLAANPGLSLNHVPVPANAGDLSAVAASAGGGDAVSTALQGAQLVPFLTAIRQLSKPNMLIATDANSLNQAVIDQLGSTADGVYAPAVFLPPNTSGNPAVDEYNSFMDKIDKSASRTDFSATAYVGVLVFAKAATGLSTVDGKSVAGALDKASGIDVGLLPPISFQRAATVIPGLTRLFNTSVVYTRVTSGKWTPVDGKFVDAFTGEPHGSA